MIIKSLHLRLFGLAKVLDSHDKWVRGNPKGTRADLSGFNLAKVSLVESNLREAKLTGANLSFADLKGANLSLADLSDANLKGANLNEANLFCTGLTGANLTGANLNEANLTGMRGKTIVSFNSARHFGYCCDGFIRIGCKTMTVQKWIDQGAAIGFENDFSTEEIETYMDWIRRML
mgnify:FL=1